MQASHLAGAAFALSGLALCLSVWSVAHQDDDALVSALAPHADPRVPELRAELDGLRSELRGLTDGIAAMPRVAATEPEGDAQRIELERVQAELVARLAALQSKVEGLEAADRATDPARRREEVTAAELRTIEDATQLALDRNGAAEQQLEGLRTLRGHRLPDGSDARDALVVQAMVELVQRSPEPEVRADVFRQLHGVDDPALRQPLLDALGGDASADVREEAAETLDEYLDDPAVRAALEHAAAHDPDAGVRRQARFTLDTST